MPVTTALADIPALALAEAEAARLGFGQAISLVELMGRVPDAADPDGGLVRAMAGERFVGLCRLESGLLKPERLMAAGGARRMLSGPSDELPRVARPTGEQPDVDHR